MNAIDYLCACDRNGKFEWWSYLRLGQLLWDGDSFEVEWTQKLQVFSNMATNNRSMELSDITWWNGNYYAVISLSLLVHQYVDMLTHSDGHRHVIIQV